MMFTAINWQCEKVLQKKCIIRLEGDASVYIDCITLTSPKNTNRFQGREENTYN